MQKMKPEIIVLTDLDDTLVDRGTFSIEAMKATFADPRFRIDVDLEEIASAPSHDTLTKKYNCDWLTFWRAFDDYDDREKAIESGRIKPYHDTIEALSALSKRCRIAITTDTPPHKSYPEITLLGIDKHVDATIAYILGHQTLKFKPDITVAIRAFKALGYHPRTLDGRGSEEFSEPDHIWVVGDGQNDMEFAENIKRYTLENRLNAKVHGIYIPEGKPKGAQYDYLAFGPSPLLTAAHVILNHQKCPYYESPIDVCWPEI